MKYKNNLIESIQKISNSEELKRAIEQLLNPSRKQSFGKIRAKTFTAYQNAIGGISGSTQGGVSGDQGTAGEVDEQTSEADDARDGEGSGDNEDVRNGDAGTKDMQDIFDNGILAGAILRGLLGLYDCNTGKQAQLWLDGLFRPPSSLYGLDGYNGNWDYDPREAQWREGVYYTFNAVTTHYSTNPYSAVEAGLGEFDSNDPPNAPHTLVSIEDYDVDAESDGATLTATLSRVAGQFTANVTIKKTGCVVGSDPYCPEEAPRNLWPSDGIHQLAFDGARFLTSPFENTDDINPSWQNGPSKISGCTSGGDQFTIEAGSTGTVGTVTFGAGSEVSEFNFDIVTGEVTSVTPAA